MDKDSILEAAARMAEAIDEEYQSPVEISPVPTVVKMHREEYYVVMTLLTPIGANTFFLDLESAERIADSMKELLNK